MLTLFADTSAHALWLRAIDAQSHLRIHEAARLYAAAVARDPGMVDYHIHFVSVTTQIEGPTRANERVADLLKNTPEGRCRALAERQQWHQLLAEWSTTKARVCVAYYVTVAGTAPPALLPKFERLLDSAGVAQFYHARALQLASAGRLREAETWLRKGLQRAEHPIDRLMIGLALADQLRTQGRNAESSDLERLLAIAAQRGPPATALWYRLLRLPRVPEDSVSSYALETARNAVRLGSDYVCADVLLAAGALYIDRGNARRAIGLLEQADACARRASYNTARVTAGVRLGRALNQSGQHDRAIQLLNEAGRLSRAHRLPYWTAEAFHNLAHAYEGKGDWTSARAAVDQFVFAAERSGNRAQRVVSLRDAGIIAWNSGQRAAARPYFEKMVRIIEAEHHDYHWAAEYYERTGDLPSARRFYLQSLTEAGDSARKYAGLTRVYLALGSADSAAHAARLHDAALQTPEEVPLLPEVQALTGRRAAAIAAAREWAERQAAKHNLAGAANAYLQLANFAYDARRYRQSGEAAESAMAFATRANQPHARIRAMTLHAASQSALGRVPEADRIFGQVLPLARRQAEPLLRADAFAAIGYARAQRRDYSAALAAFDSASAIRNRIVDRFDDNFDRVRFSASFTGAFDRALERIVATGNVALTHEWLQRRKRISSRGYLPAAQVRARLRPNEAVIEYFVTDSLIAAVVLSRDTALVQALPVTRHALQQMVNTLRAPVTAYFGKVDAIRARYDYATAAALYQKLIAPLNAALNGRQRLFVQLDDVLQIIPLDALVISGTGARAQFVIDRHEVVNIMSMAAISGVPNPGRRATTVITGDVPGASAEAAAIRERWPVKVIANATEAQTAAALRSARVVHMAVHGEADVQQPLSSYLRVAADHAGDGLLHVAEIERMPVRAELVVLTACETVNSRMFSGDGAMSLARAFMTAGAKSVIATHWSVGDLSANFSATFYATLSRRDAATALRAAKLEMRRRPGSNPLEWAPFVLVMSD